MRSLRLTLLILAPALATSSLLAQHPGGTSGAGASMHGGAPAAQAPAVLAPVSFAEGVKADKQVATFMEGFAQALFTRDGKPMVPQLAEKYVIEGWPAEKNMHDAFVQALTMIPTPTKIRITAITQEGDIKVVQTELAFAKRVAKRSFNFDASGKLLNTDFISMKRPAPAKPAAPAAQPEPK